MGGRFGTLAGTLAGFNFCTQLLSMSKESFHFCVKKQKKYNVWWCK